MKVGLSLGFSLTITCCATPTHRSATYHVTRITCAPCQIGEFAKSLAGLPSCGVVRGNGPEAEAWERCVNAHFQAGTPFRAEAVSGGIDASPRQILGRVPDGGVMLWSEDMNGGNPCTTKVSSSPCPGIELKYGAYIECPGAAPRKVCSEEDTQQVHRSDERNVNELRCQGGTRGELYFGCAPQNSGQVTPRVEGPNLDCIEGPQPDQFVCWSEKPPKTPREAADSGASLASPCEQ